MSGDQVPLAVNEKVLTVFPGSATRLPVLAVTRLDGDAERSAEGLSVMLGNSDERSMFVCACACSTAAKATAILRLSVSAVAISPSSSGLLKPCHHSFAGQTPTFSGIGPSNLEGISLCLRAIGSSLEQPAAARA